MLLKWYLFYHLSLLFLIKKTNSNHLCTMLSHACRTTGKGFCWLSQWKNLPFFCKFQTDCITLHL